MRAVSAAPTIRAYRTEDAAALLALFQASVSVLAAEAYDLAQRRAWAPDEPDLAAWRDRFAGLRMLVAEFDGQPAGFIGFQNDGYIDLLYVSPEHARRGVASALFTAAAGELAAAGRMALRVEASLVAEPFFRRQGFSIVEEQRVERGGVSLRRYLMRRG